MSQLQWWTRLTRTGKVGLLFLASNVLGYVLAIAYNLPSCANACNAGSTRWPGVLLSGNALEAPLWIIAIFLLGFWLTMRKDRWGLIGLVLVALYGVGFIGGSISEPFNFWVARDGNFGWSLFQSVSFVLAGGLTLEAAWEIVDRARHGWRRVA